MAKQKLNIITVIDFKKSFWLKTAQYIKKWIKNDMLNGEVQESQGKPYNAKYRKYKSHEMRRFSDNKKLGSPRTLKDGTTKTYKNNNYYGKNTNTSATPNMLLTGETIKGLAYKTSNKQSMIMSYKKKDADKIAGNEKLGRDIRTLNDKNMKKLQTKFEEEIGKNLRQWCNKKIILTVGN